MSAPPKPNTALTEGAILKTLFLFSLPILAGNVLQSLNGSVNAVWVGRFLGEAALTATSNANTIRSSCSARCSASAWRRRS